MPRVATKRGLFWGTGILGITGLARTLDRRERGEEWRKERNFRRFLREHPEVTLLLPEAPEGLVTLAPATAPRLSWIRRLWIWILTWFRR